MPFCILGNCWLWYFLLVWLVVDIFLLVYQMYRCITELMSRGVAGGVEVSFKRPEVSSHLLVSFRDHRSFCIVSYS